MDNEWQPCSFKSKIKRMGQTDLFQIISSRQLMSDGFYTGVMFVLYSAIQANQLAFK